MFLIDPRRFFKGCCRGQSFEGSEFMILPRSTSQTKVSKRFAATYHECIYTLPSCPTTMDYPRTMHPKDQELIDEQEFQGKRIVGQLFWNIFDELQMGTGFIQKSQSGIYYILTCASSLVKFINSPQQVKLIEVPTSKIQSVHSQNVIFFWQQTHNLSGVQIKPTQIILHPKFMATKKSKYDLAIITIDQLPFYSSDFQIVSFRPIDNKICEGKVTIIGYPYYDWFNNPSEGHLYRTQAVLQGCDQSVIKYKEADLFVGYAGSPIIIADEESKESQIIGMHIGYDQIDRLNYGVFLNQEHIKWIEETIECRVNLADISMILDKKAMEYFYPPDYMKAIRLLQGALEIRLKQYNENHEDVDQVYNDMATIYSNKGDYKEALKNLKKSLKIRQAIYGEKHALLATAMNDIGVVYYKMNKYEDALGYQRKCLGIRIDLFGENHIEVAKIRTNMALSYHGLQDHWKAMECYEKAEWFTSKQLGLNHPISSIIKKNKKRTMMQIYSCSPKKITI